MSGIGGPWWVRVGTRVLTSVLARAVSTDHSGSGPTGCTHTTAESSMTLLFFGVFVRTFYASLPAAVPIFASLYYTKLLPDGGGPASACCSACGIPLCVSLSRLRPGYRFLGMTIAGGGRSGFFFSHPTSALCHKAYAIGQLKVICVIKFQRPIVVNDPPYCDFCEAAVEFKINDSPRV